MNKLIVKIIVAMACSSAIFVNAKALSANEPELKQLEAMGYESKDTKDGSSTIASVGSARILISKNAERTIIFRMFEKGKKLNDAQELELYRVINEINYNNSYQVSLSDGYLTVALYSFGSHEAKTFAKLIRLMENANSLFDSYPKLLELLK